MVDWFTEMLTMLPAARGPHPRYDLARDQEVAGQVGPDHGAEAVGRHLPEALRPGHEPLVDRAHSDPAPAKRSTPRSPL
jgi:hypothetical protein